MTITTKLYTFFRGELVGTDPFGNRYYRRKSHDEKRWVIYNGKAEPSKVPAEWHGWLHYTHDHPPAEGASARYAWKKPHLPNLTGTPLAYRPPGHAMKGDRRDPTTSDYEPWTP